MDLLRSANLYLRSHAARPFRTVEFDPDRWDRQMSRPKAERTYVILFTPRSGSSRVTDILKSTKGLSRASEVFNPRFMPRMARKLNAPGLPQYLEILARRYNDGGLFGFQTTYQQMRVAFRSDRAFHTAFADADLFVLLRRDIVAQAVSLVKMAQTQVAHATTAKEADLERAEQTFRYDAGAIAKELRRLLWQERCVDTLLTRFESEPVRLVYEDLSALSDPEVAALFARHLNVSVDVGAPAPSSHRKLAGERSAEFAERFTADMTGSLRRSVEARRV